MKLNKLEFMAMNSPIKAFFQERYEFKMVRAMSSRKGSHLALEIGCGNGNGTRLIKKYFSPQTVIGIDLDQRMIKIAEKRNSDDSVSYKVMDAAKLDFPDKYFDSIYDFGIIHHIPNWKETLSEIKRVLKPDGELIIEDLSINSFSTGTGKLWRILSDHPYQFMYTPQQFTEFLREIGFTIVNYKETYPLYFVKFFYLTAIFK